jgi:hypothetical protein
MAGFPISEGTALEEAKDMVAGYREVRYYVHDVWEEMTGQRPKDGVVSTDTTAGIARLIVKQPGLFHAINRIQEDRDQQMWDAADLDRDEEGELPGAFKEYKPRIQRDDTFRQVATLIHEEAGHCLKPVHDRSKHAEKTPIHYLTDWFLSLFGKR